MRDEIEGHHKSDTVRLTICVLLDGILLDAHGIKGGTVNTYPIKSSFTITRVGP